MAGRTITEPAEGSGLISSVIRNQLQILEDEITLVSPGGADTYVQFNDGGTAFGGSANFTWNDGSKILKVKGGVEFNNAADSLSIVNGFDASFVSVGLATFNTDGYFQLYSNGGHDVILSNGAISTSATGGFVQLPTSAGTPTGVPASVSLGAPTVWDSTNSILYVYSSGAWHSTAGVSSGANAALSNLSGVAINTTLLPGTNDGAALGDTTHNFSDLFLATGAVINYANGNVVITHTSGILTMGTGDFRVSTAGTNSASVVTVGGTQTLTNKTLTSPTLTTPSLGVATATSINGNFFTTGTYTLTGQAGKTLTFNGSITLTGTDAATYTFPSSSKTIAANDGSNLTLGSQAIGDLLTASSTTAYTRLAAVAVGSVLVSAGTGTQPVWSAGPQVTTIELGNATDTTIARVSGGQISVEGVQVVTLSNAVTLTSKTLTAPIMTAVAETGIGTADLLASNQNTVSVTSNAGSCSQSFLLNKFTNSSAATMAITIPVATPTPKDGQFLEVRIYDFSGVAQTIGWTNTENSTVSAPLTSNGSTTLPLSVLFQYNASTSKWRTIATA